MKKLLLGGIVAGLLALPATAAAGTVIPFGTYNGTFSTGLGGTIQIDVNIEGTNFDLDASNWGQTGCEYGTLGLEDVPIDENGGFSQTLSDPFRATFGSFGSPGTVSGSLQITGNGFCNSGSQSWSATTPVAWGDARISAAGKTKGQDIYDRDGGPKQTLKRTVKKGRKARFKIVIENDGTIDGLFNIKGCEQKAATYKSGGEDITDEIKSGGANGGMEQEIDSGEEFALQLSYSAKQGKTGSTKRCLVRANNDAVVAVTKIAKEHHG